MWVDRRGGGCVGVCGLVWGCLVGDRLAKARVTDSMEKSWAEAIPYCLDIHLSQNMRFFILGHTIPMWFQRFVKKCVRVSSRSNFPLPHSLRSMSLGEKWALEVSGHRCVTRQREPWDYSHQVNLDNALIEPQWVCFTNKGKLQHKISIPVSVANLGVNVKCGSVCLVNTIPPCF